MHAQGTRPYISTFMYHPQSQNYLFFSNEDTKIIKAAEKDPTFYIVIFFRGDGSDESHLTRSADKALVLALPEACLS